MEREILFRAKRIDNGEYVYGYYCEAEMFDHTGTEYFIIEYSCDGTQYHVASATVGRYTGLTDKNGKKIFEGDIIHVVTPTTTGNYQVKFGYGMFYIGINMPLAYVRHSCEIIGNIHDNPELLEVQG